jgi:hypothetical protein
MQILLNVKSGGTVDKPQGTLNTRQEHVSYKCDV